ncbi:hypothetical protein EDC25_1441 [Pseudofulvimonas gallinarii]|uniref:Uncharacterized protein n=1 Tax=Pseudofulvimonas gallinarii TaxID=634155 RepID=A0A4R3KZK0_9GAMM|nr:hypothetical protein EDC25_1441 [Pseudofulvimonas gallinarii]
MGSQHGTPHEVQCLLDRLEIHLAAARLHRGWWLWTGRRRKPIQTRTASYIDTLDLTGGRSNMRSDGIPIFRTAIGDFDQPFHFVPTLKHQVGIHVGDRSTMRTERSLTVAADRGTQRCLEHSAPNGRHRKRTIAVAVDLWHRSPARLSFHPRSILRPTDEAVKSAVHDLAILQAAGCFDLITRIYAVPSKQETVVDRYTDGARKNTTSRKTCPRRVPGSISAENRPGRKCRRVLCCNQNNWHIRRSKACLSCFQFVSRNTDDNTVSDYVDTRTGHRSGRQGDFQPQHRIRTRVPELLQGPICAYRQCAKVSDEMRISRLGAGDFE